MSPRVLVRRALAPLGFVAAALAAPSHAGYITQPEAQLDRIFAQPSFGTRRVDVRFNPRQSIYSAPLVRADTSSDIFALFGRATSPNTVYAFYVDTVDWCGSYATGIIGCGEMPGNAIVIESRWAANPTYGHVLLAHEIGHNLGLSHASQTVPNLMTPTLTTSTAINGTQVSRILSSSLVQWVNGVRTLSITPVAVTGPTAALAPAAPGSGTSSASAPDIAAVPEPGAAALAILALAAAGVCGRRRPRRAGDAQASPRRAVSATTA